MHGNRAARQLLSALLLLALLAIPSPATAEPIAELINQHRLETDLLHLPIERTVLEALPVFDVTTSKLRLRSPSESCDNDTGSFLILHLWATWCGPCKEELALWKRLVARLGRQMDKDYPGQYGEMRIVHVAMQKDVSTLGAFLKEMADRMPPGPVFVDRDGRLAALLRERLKREARLPLTLWLGPGRSVRQALVGPINDRVNDVLDTADHLMQWLKSMRSDSKRPAKDREVDTFTRLGPCACPCICD